ncbi:MAG: trigger factor [Eubacteriales bacterium]
MSLKSSNKVEANVYELEIAVDAAEFKATVLKVFNKKKSSINVPGFRKGKAPLSLIERTYGKDVFYEDALEMLFPDAVDAAYKEGNINAIDSPFDVDVKEIGEDGVLFTLKVTVKPEIEVTQYKGLQGEKAEVIVNPFEVDQELDKLRERNSRTIVVEDRAAQDGDMTIIDYEGFVDGVAFDGGKDENHSLTLGSGSFIPGFEEQIIGHNLADEFDVNVSFPDEYAPELAGKAAVFKVKLHEIKVKEIPEIDEDFAKDVSEFETVEELKKGTKEDIRIRKQEEADKAFEGQVLDALADNVTGEIPEVMFKKRAKENTDSFTQRLSQQGADLDTYFMYVGLDRETFDAQMFEQAKKQVALQLALEKIGDLEGITVSEEDFAAEYQKLADMYSIEVDKLKGIIPEDNMKTDIINEKAVKFVVENAIAVAPKIKSTEDPKEKNNTPEVVDLDNKPAAKKRAAKKKGE